MLDVSPSSSCRLRWVLNLNLNLNGAAHTHYTQHTSTVHTAAGTGATADSTLQPPRSLSLTQCGHDEYAGGEPVLGGRLDGLSDSPEHAGGGGAGEKCQQAYEENYGGFEGHGLTLCGALSLQRVRWSVELRQPSVE